MGFIVAPWAIGDDEIFASLLYMYYDENIKFQNCEDLSLGDLSKIKKKGSADFVFQCEKTCKFHTCYFNVLLCLFLFHQGCSAGSELS